MESSLDLEAVYEVVVAEGKNSGAWPALIADRLGVDKAKVRPALLRLQDAGRVHEINHNWYPGLLPESVGARVHHPQSVVLMISEAWGFIAEHHPKEEWPSMMRQGYEELRAQGHVL